MKVSPGGSLGKRAQGREGPTVLGHKGTRTQTLAPSCPCTFMPFCVCTLSSLHPLALVPFYPYTLVPTYPSTLLPSNPCALPPLCPLTLAPFHLCMHEGTRVWGHKGHQSVRAWGQVKSRFLNPQHFWVQNVQINLVMTGNVEGPQHLEIESPLHLHLQNSWRPS